MSTFRFWLGNVIGMVTSPALAWLAINGNVAAENVLPFYYVIVTALAGVTSAGIAMWLNDGDMDQLAKVATARRPPKWVGKVFHAGRIAVAVAAAAQGWYVTATLALLASVVGIWYTTVTREARLAYERQQGETEGER